MDIEQQIKEAKKLRHELNSHNAETIDNLLSIISQQAEETKRLIALLERMDDCGTTGEDARDMHMYVNEALRGSADKWNTSC